MKINSRQSNVAFQKNPTYTKEKAKLNAPISDKFTLRNTPGSAGLTPRPAINLLTPPSAAVYENFKTANPAIRLLKAISKIFKH